MAACVTVDTLVSTPEGEKPIGDIKPWETINAFDSQGLPIVAEVVSVRREPSEIMEVTTASRTLLCTPSHVLQQFSGDMSETSVGQLKVGDGVLTVDGIELIETIRPVGREDVVILKLNNEYRNYAFTTDGFFSLDDYRTAQVAGA